MFERDFDDSFMNGDNKDISPDFQALAIFLVAVMASGNDFQLKSVVTGTSQL